MGKAIQFLKETRAELSKVVWPTRLRALRLTVIVVIITAIFGAFLTAVDFGLNKGIQYVIDTQGGTGAPAGQQGGGQPGGQGQGSPAGQGAPPGQNGQPAPGGQLPGQAAPDNQAPGGEQPAQPAPGQVPSQPEQ